jgi:hypothetical protein
MTEHTIVIDEDGTARFQYHDDLVPLREALGTSTITRAASVEPTSTGEWCIDPTPLLDMAPEDERFRANVFLSARLDRRIFPLREEALKKEREVVNAFLQRF